MNVYADLERAERAPKRVADHTATWSALELVESVNGQVGDRLLAFCESKRITVEALAALGARVVVRRGGKVELAFAGDNGADAITAVKYRPIGGTSRDCHAEEPSTWLRPIVAGRLDALDWIVAEGETDAARLWGLVGDRAAILVLPAGARTFRREWAGLIPRGATVALAYDADEQGDKGAAKAAKMIGGRTFRLRPPVDGGDWCDWPGDIRAFLELVAAAGAKLAGGLTVVRASDVAMRSIEWLEKPLWQGSAFQLLAGSKGAGKGTYLASFAADVSKSTNVLFVATEDSAAIDLVPRLTAAGANLDRVHIIEQHIQLPADVAALEALALDLGGVGLLVIDPVANHIGDSNSNNDAEVRHAIAPLNKLADDLGCLIIGVRHPGKDRSRGAVASILGSTAWVDTPRAVVMIAVDDEDPLVRHIQCVAGNRSLNGSAQAFRIDAVDVPGLLEPITRATMLGESTKSVDDLLASDGKTDERISPDALQAAILEALATGSKSRDYLDEIGRDLGVTKNAVYERGLIPLRSAGEIEAFKGGLNDRWSWRLSNSGDDAL